KACISSISVDKIGCTSSKDYKCFCKHQDDIKDMGKKCVIKACGLSGAFTMASAAKALCDCAA
ncbi:hypothetical protein LTS18_010396, partial [Coniosporium uncinatum]